jgi:hypothetical protein
VPTRGFYGVYANSLLSLTGNINGKAVRMSYPNRLDAKYMPGSAEPTNMKILVTDPPTLRGGGGAITSGGTYTGGVNVSGGTLTFDPGGNGWTLPPIWNGSGSVTLDGGTLGLPTPAITGEQLLNSGDPAEITVQVVGGSTAILNGTVEMPTTSLMRWNVVNGYTLVGLGDYRYRIGRVQPVDGLGPTGSPS